MIVDDHAGFRRMIRELVSREGDRVRECASGDEAVDCAEEFRPDVVTLDVRMPGLDGLAAAVLLRRLVPAARLIFVTQYGEPELRAAARQAGASGYVVKEELADLAGLIGRGAGGDVLR